MIFGSMSRPGLKVLVLTGLVSLMAACTSTGNSFNTTALHQLVPGQTTLDEAIIVLGADPVNIYRQRDGSATSIWSHKNSMLTDAIYLNQELWLAFGPDGRFQRVLKKHNLPVAPPPGNPAPVHPAAATQPPGRTVSTPVVVPAFVAEPASTPVIDRWNTNQPAVSYPINN